MGLQYSSSCACVMHCIGRTGYLCNLLPGPLHHDLLAKRAMLNEEPLRVNV